MIEKAKTWFWYLGGVVILLLLAGNCTNSLADRYFGEGDVLQKQYHAKIEALNQEKIKSQKIIDSLKEDNNQKDMQIGGLQELNNDNDKKIALLSQKAQDGVKVAKTYTYKQSAEFISKAYNAPKSVSYTNQGITLVDSIPNRVVETIIDRDFFKKKLELTEENLNYTGKQVILLEDKVKNKDLEIKTISDLSLRKDDALEASKDLNEATKKENKKLKTSRWIDRALIVGAFVGGILLTK